MVVEISKFRKETISVARVKRSVKISFLKVEKKEKKASMD